MLFDGVFSWFRRAPAPIAPGSLQEPSEPLALTPTDRERFDELERQVARLSSQLADVQLAWAETLDKLQAWANRQATRDRRSLGRNLDAAESIPEAPQHAQEPAGSAAPPTKAELRARLAALQRRA